MNEEKLASAMAKLARIREERAARPELSPLAAWGLRQRVGWLQYSLERIEGRLGNRYETERRLLEQQIANAETLLLVVDHRTPALTPQDEAALTHIRTCGEFTVQHAIETDRFAGVVRLRPDGE